MQMCIYEWVQTKPIAYKLINCKLSVQGNNWESHEHSFYANLHKREQTSCINHPSMLQYVSGAYHIKLVYKTLEDFKVTIFFSEFHFVEFDFLIPDP